LRLAGIFESTGPPTGAARRADIRRLCTAARACASCGSAPVLMSSFVGDCCCYDTVLPVQCVPCLFARLTQLQGLVSGRCFAGNAVLLACCDVVIATHNSNMGLGGPVSTSTPPPPPPSNNPASPLMLITLLCTSAHFLVLRAGDGGGRRPWPGAAGSDWTVRRAAEDGAGRSACGG
jgi:hypothetical protein